MFSFDSLCLYVSKITKKLDYNQNHITREGQMLTIDNGVK